MSSFSIFRAVLSCVIGVTIGVVFTAVVNLVSPSDNVVRTIIVVCLSALVSGFVGYIMGARQKKQA